MIGMLFKSNFPRFLQVKNFSTSLKHNKNIAVVGASGGIGQPLSLLLKTCSLIKKLSLTDVSNTKGIAMDLSHISTRSSVHSFEKEELAAAFDGADIIIIAAGRARKPNMSRSDLFCENAQIIYNIVGTISCAAPNALLGIITNPVNSTLAIAAETFKLKNAYNPKKIFGVTNLDIIRAQTFIANNLEISPTDVQVPVIGGHSSETMIPLISQAKPDSTFSPEEVKTLTNLIKKAGTEVVNAKVNGSATLSMAYAAALFVTSLLRALNGEKGVVEYAMVENSAYGTKYFASPVLLGPEGMEKCLDIGKLTPFEQDLFENAIPLLKADIKKGEDFVKEATSSKNEVSNSI